MVSVTGESSAPASRAGKPGSAHGSLGAQSWKTASVRHIAQQVVQPLIKQASSLIHAYMVCGLNRDPTAWLVAPKSTIGRPQRTPGGVGSFLLPQILGSIPAHERDEESVQMFAAALKVSRHLLALSSADLERLCFQTTVRSVLVSSLQVLRAIHLCCR